MRGKSLFITRLAAWRWAGLQGANIRRMWDDLWWRCWLVWYEAEPRWGKFLRSECAADWCFCSSDVKTHPQQPTYDGWSCECRLVCRLEIWQLIEQKCAQILCLSSDTAGSFWCSCNLWEIIKSIYTTFYKLNNVCASRSWSFCSSKHWIQQ